MGVEHRREVKSPSQMVCGVIHPLELFMSNYLLAAIGINRVLSLSCRPNALMITKRLQFCLGLWLEKFAGVSARFFTACVFVLLEFGFSEISSLKPLLSCPNFINAQEEGGGKNQIKPLVYRTLSKLPSITAC